MFRDVIVMIDGLDSWLPASGFSTDFPPDRGAESTASYTPPSNYVAETSLGKLTLEPYLERRAERRSVVLREGWRFDMDLNSPLKLGDVASRVTQPLLNLVTLVTQRPAVIQKLSVHSNAAPETRAPGYFRPIEVLYPPIGKLEPVTDFRLPLVSLAEISSDFNELITRWLAVSADNDLGPVLGSFFGIQYAPPGFVELRFLTMATALESYHERRHPGATQIPSETFDRRTSILAELASNSEDLRSVDRKWLKGVLKSANQASLHKRLAGLLNELEDALPHPIPEVGLVSEKLATTRNHLAHGSDELAERALTGLDRFWGEQLLHLLLTTLLLKELGLSGAFIAESWKKFPWYAWAWEGIGTIDFSQLPIRSLDSERVGRHCC